MATDSDPPPAAWTARRARPGEIGPELAARLDADRIEAEEIYAREEALEAAGIELPPPDPATISMPNLPTEVVPVRLAAATLAKLRAAAADRGTTVDSVIRAAVLGWLRASPPQRRNPPTAADYAAMAQSYEADPPRRDEMVGEPFIAPSALEQDRDD